MHGNLKDLEKQSPSSMSCINTSPSGIYSLPCSRQFQASHSLFLPQRSCVTPTLRGPCWSLKTSKVLPPQVGKNPRAHIKAQIPAFLLPLPAQQCKEAAGSCVHTHNFEEMTMSGRARSSSPLLNFHRVLANQILQLSLDKRMLTRLDMEQRG